jgi:hypothetical protein
MRIFLGYVLALLWHPLDSKPRHGFYPPRFSAWRSSVRSEEKMFYRGCARELSFDKRNRFNPKI